MFTVIFLSSSAKEIYASAQDYFAPFVEAKKIAFCEWNESSRACEMRDAVPDLPEIIRGQSHWRAVVVDHPRNGSGHSGLQVRDPENPFDFVENTQLSLNLENSKHALIRLAHILLGYPQMTAKKFKPYLQYEDPETGDVIEGDPREILVDIMPEHERQMDINYEGGGYSDDEVFGLVSSIVGQTRNNVQRLFKEVEYSDDEKSTHLKLAEQYRMKEVRPSEVLFIATRMRIEEDEKSLLQRAWKSEEEHHASRFVERNDYPPMSRFAIYNLLESENSGYDQDLLRFWLGVLTLAKNQVPPGSLQAERVYELGVEFGIPQLGEMLNGHISQLAMVRDHLDRLINTQAKPPSSEVSDGLAPVETDVDFDDLGGDELRAEYSRYGLASDIPVDEYRRWGAEVSRIASAAALFMRKPRRLVARAVLGARELIRLDRGTAIVLDEFEREELEDQLTRRLRSLVVPATADLLDQRRLQRTLDRGDEEVRSIIRQRMKSSTIWIATFVSLGIWLATFVPYLLQAGRSGTEALLGAMLVTLLVLAVISGAGLLALLVMRRRLIDRIADFNHGIDFEVVEVKRGAARFASYLSDFVTYRRGSERLRSALRARDQRARELNRLRTLRTRIVRQINEEKEIVLSLGVPLEVQRTSKGLLEFEANNPLAERDLFRFPVGEGRIPFNESGEFVKAPYDFVTRLSLLHTPIFERLPQDHQRGEA